MTTGVSQGSLSIDLFWSFRSPYSYLATPRLVALTAEYDLEISVRPVRPIAVRDPQFFNRANPLWGPYLLRDTRRIAEFFGLNFSWPRPDPVVQDYANRRIPQEQPYIHRLTRLGTEAARRGKGLPFIDEVSRVIWGGRVVGWHQGAHLADAARRLVLTSLRSTRRSALTNRSSMPQSRGTRKPSKRQATGAFPQWCFRVSPSLDKTGLTFLCGDCSNTACDAAKAH